jgi:hypothetical protein
MKYVLRRYSFYVYYTIDEDAGCEKLGRKIIPRSTNGGLSLEKIMSYHKHQSEKTQKEVMFYSFDIQLYPDTHR